MAFPLAAPTTNETAAARIERELREAIVRLELLPGARLSEQEIATRFGASRQPVREALIALAKSGFLEARPNRGTVVVKISVQQMLEARFVREAVEVAVVRRASENFDPMTREQVATNLRQQKDVVGSEDPHQFRLLDAKFHFYLAKGAGCSLAWHTIADTKAQFDRVGNLMIIKRDNRELLLEQHKAIVDAIDVHDPDTAEAVMREHLHYILRDLPAAAEIYRDWFE
ncbi:MAG: GntR family transcriptional regulator [Alphaproteobacteria bacterium]|nr:GntR family transcriptional regulator [Alphaproteobacteria bacterium]